MRTYHAISALLLLTISQFSFAHNKQCEMIAKSCVKAGYTDKTDAKREFWHSCMERVLLGKAVKGVKISAEDATTCKESKITEMKKEIELLEQTPNPTK